MTRQSLLILANQHLLVQDDKYTVCSSHSLARSNLKESKEKYVYVSEGQVQKVLQEPAAHLKVIKNQKNRKIICCQ